MAPKYRIPFVSLLALSAAMPAFAQEGPQPPVDADEGRDVIVITANKREETVQDVAVAVTAISSDAKQELGIITITDMTNVTPGLSYTPSNERVTLRGIGRLSNSIGADPGRRQLHGRSVHVLRHNRRPGRDAHRARRSPPRTAGHAVWP